MFRNALARFASATVVSGAVVLGATQVANAAPSLPQLHPGDKGQYVLTLQAELIRIGYPLKGTGYYGPETKKAVRDWQQANDIKASGIVGPMTWESLTGCGVPNPNYAPNLQLTPGQKLTSAQAEQLMVQLGWVGYYFPTWGEAVVPGKVPTHYNGRYVTVVKQLQKRSGIKASGILGAKTSNVLNLISSTQDRCVG